MHPLYKARRWLVARTDTRAHQRVFPSLSLSILGYPIPGD